MTKIASRTLLMALLLGLLFSSLNACEVDDDDDFVADQGDASDEDMDNSPDASQEDTGADMTEADADEPDTSGDMGEDVGEDMDEGCGELSCPAPVSFCQGSQAFYYSGAGSLNEDCACDYSQVLTVETCDAVQGEYCKEGRCTPIETCGDTGPQCPEQQEVCVGSTRVVYAAACEEEECVLGQEVERQSCDQCISNTNFTVNCIINDEPEEPGRGCVADSDCQASYCEGDVVHTYATSGVCTDQICVYEGSVSTEDCAVDSMVCVSDGFNAYCQ